MDRIAKKNFNYVSQIINLSVQKNQFMCTFTNGTVPKCAVNMRLYNGR